MNRPSSRAWFVIVALASMLAAVLALVDWSPGVEGPKPEPSVDVSAPPSDLPGPQPRPTPPPENARELARDADALRSDAFGVRVERGGEAVAGARIVCMPETWRCALFVIDADRLVRVNTLPTTWSTARKQGDFEVLGETDAHGRCALPPGTGGVAVAVFDPEKQTLQSRWHCVGDRAGLQRDLLIRLAPPVRIRGRAVDADTGEVVPASIRMLTAAGASTADGDQLYVLEHQAEGGELQASIAADTPLVLVCECAGYHPSVHTVSTPEHGATVDVALRDAGSIRGRVLTEAGIAVPGVTVQGRSGFLGTGRSTSTSDANGAWAIAARGAALRITARKTGFLDATVANVQRGQRDVEIVLQRTPCRPVQGRVLLADRTPAAGATVEAWPLVARTPPPQPLARMGSRRPAAAAQTDASGQFRFEQLPLGDYAFDVRPAPRAEHIGTAAVTNIARHTLAADGGNDFVELQLPQLGEIVLTYPPQARERLLHGQPATRLPFVLLKRVFDQEKLASVVVTELPLRGPLRFGGLVAGHYVVITTPKSQPVHRELQPGASISMALSSSHQLAEVRIERQAAPLVGCQVSYLDMRTELVSHATTDARGRVELAVPTAGDGMLRLEAADGAVALLRSHLSPLRGNLIVWPTAGVELRLRADAGLDGAGSVAIAALEVEGVRLPRAVAVTSREVAELRSLTQAPLIVDGLSPGTYRVTIQHTGQPARTGEVRIAGPSRTQATL